MVFPGTAHEEIRLVDFGIAFLLDLDARLTYADQVVGTMMYMAPEYAMERRVSKAMDVYQMGLILVEMLTGQPMIQGETGLACMVRHANGELFLPEYMVRSPLGPVLVHALAVDPDERYPDAQTFLRALEGIDPATIPEAGSQTVATSYRVSELTAGDGFDMTLFNATTFAPRLASEADIPMVGMPAVEGGSRRLGAFVVDDFIAEGGMGQVWRGRHWTEDIPVAIKFLRHDHGQDAVQRELQAIARLGHPNIITLFDTGEASPDLSVALEGRIHPRAPYMVMEYAPGGTLRDLLWEDHPHDWHEVQPILKAILKALAHAHARGVLHLDLKPHNVLLWAHPPEVHLKLSDFGLAHMDHADASAPLVPTGTKGDIMGTPKYMAPEQFGSQWRDYGPWTDLYAFGILAYELVCGTPPFRANSVEEYLTSHTQRALPRPQFIMDVPQGLADWLRFLTAKSIQARCQRAYDATWALEQLEQGGERVFSVLQPTTAQVLPSRTEGAVVELSPDDQTVPLVVDAALSEEALAVGRWVAGLKPTTPTLVRRPPCPPRWGQDEPPQLPMHLVGSGLELYNLRERPLVDREAQRDLMWSALAQTASRGSCAALVLEGGAGYGKSHLARWLCEQAHTYAVAQPLVAHHAMVSGVSHGLAHMLASALRCQHLPPAELAERLEAQWHQRGLDDQHAWRALGTVILGRPLDVSGVQPVQFGDRTEMFRLIVRVLGYLGSQLPLLIWLDDVHWGAETLAFVQHCLSAPSPEQVPMLFVLTVNTDILPERPIERPMVEAILQAPNVERLPVGPLPPADSAQVVQQLLDLSQTLTQDLVEQMRGNPLFAVRLVREWIRQDILEPSDSGFVLREGCTVELPEDLHQIWRREIDSILARHPLALPPLEVAAALGQAFVEVEFLGACRQAHLTPEPGLLVQMQRRGLVQP
ncbi:MAG: protein kinase, partial [Myxococcota bacterium]